MYHGMIAYFDCVEPYMPDRIVKQFGWVLCVPAHPIRPQEHRRLVNNRVYMVKNVFIEALWLEALSHLLTSTWTSNPAIPPSRCTDDYMPWFLPALIYGFRIRTGSPAACNCRPLLLLHHRFY
ncbi:hypothetical protein M9H77_25310 [Catharanthus roseus]|uniref:Uncharacterized protein n=1 Tax=Catharanthus roseus TaxID=4058 RepID=A0ACC0A6H8_CATRO|nr:hypothetical protein M9H77_25310 [Catharanthus roseus]